MFQWKVLQNIDNIAHYITCQGEPVAMFQWKVLQNIDNIARLHMSCQGEPVAMFQWKVLQNIDSIAHYITRLVKVSQWPCFSGKSCRI